MNAQNMGEVDLVKKPTINYEVVDKIAHEIRANPEKPYYAPSHWYNRIGEVRYMEDGLERNLRRTLYQVFNGLLEPGQPLYGDKRDLNPNNATLERPVAVECKNGHPYPTGSVPPRRCMTCWLERTGGNGEGKGSANRQKLFCPEGHRYDEGNTYWQKPNQPGQAMRRKCKTCATQRRKPTNQLNGEPNEY